MFFLANTFSLYAVSWQMWGEWESIQNSHGKEKEKTIKWENTDIAEKLLQINRELKLKRQKETLEAEKKGKGRGAA